MVAVGEQDWVCIWVENSEVSSESDMTRSCQNASRKIILCEINHDNSDIIYAMILGLF